MLWTIFSAKNKNGLYREHHPLWGINAERVEEFEQLE